MPWIFTGKGGRIDGIWWKIIGGNNKDNENHPTNIIYQYPNCYRCNLKYTEDFCVNAMKWRNINNKKNNNNIYCENCHYFFTNITSTNLYNYLKNREIKTNYKMAIFS